MSYSFIARVVKAVLNDLHYSEGCLHLVDSIVVEPTDNPFLFTATVQLTIQNYMNGKQFPICIG